jgi:hypothetical protein
MNNVINLRSRENALLTTHNIHSSDFNHRRRSAWWAIITDHGMEAD